MIQLKLPFGFTPNLIVWSLKEKEEAEKEIKELKLKVRSLKGWGTKYRANKKTTNGKRENI